MVRLEIIANGLILDLYPGAENDLSITRQIFDLRDFSTRNSSFTSKLSIPITSRNQDILDLPASVFSRKKITGYVSHVRMNGVEVISNGVLRAFFNGKDFDIQLDFGNFDFYNTLVGDVADLDWSDLDMDWDVTSLIAIRTQTSDIVPGLATYFKPEDTRNLASVSTWKANIDINFYGFHLYVKQAVERIITDKGYTLDQDELIAAPSSPATRKASDIENNLWEKPAFCCPVTKFVEISQQGSPIFATVKSTSSQEESNIGTFRIDFDTVISDTAGLFSLALEEFEFVSERSIEVRLQVSGTLALPTEPGARRPVAASQQIRIMKNDSMIAAVFIKVGDFIHNILGRTTVKSGDKIHAEVELDDSEYIVNFNTDAKFSVIERSTDTVDRSIFIRDYIPQIKQKDLISWAITMNNLMLDVDEQNKIVKLKPLDHVMVDSEQDFSKNLIANMPDKISSEGFNHFQENILRYAENKDLIRTDADAVFKFNNENLPRIGDFVKVGFGASDLAHEGGFKTVNLGNQYPMYDMESSTETGLNHNGGGGDGTFTLDTALDFNPGDYIDSAEGVKKITNKVSTTAGTCQGTWSGNFGPISFNWIRFKIGKLTPPRIAWLTTGGGNTKWHDGDTLNVTSGASGYPAEFKTDALSWGYLTENNYKNILSSLKNPMILTAWFSFSVAEFVAIDFMLPVYVKKYGTKFLLNKIIQYKANGLCQLELIRI